MGYDDRYGRRGYDDETPRRSSGSRGDGYSEYDAPRSGPPSRPRNSRPRDDYGDYGPPRSSSSSRPRRDDDAYRGGSARSSRPRDEYDQPRTRRRDDGSRSGGARDMMRRVRDSLTGAYDALSREVRSMRSRADSRSAGPSRSRRDDYDDVAPRNREWVDDDDYSRAPAGRASSSGGGRNASGTQQPTAARNTRNKSLALKLINRRRRVREGGMKPGTRAAMVTVFAVLGVILIIGGGIGSGYAYAMTQQYAEVIANLGLSRTLQSSRIYDRHGVLLYQTFGQQNGTRDYLDYCDIPKIVQAATVDTEDHTFWSNPGVDPIGLIRAATVDLNHSGNTQGGSTITQQLVKLAVLGDSSRKIGRKIDEAILAINVTQHYSKQDILTMYLNIVPYGFNYEGIEAAAENYFHLKPKVVSPNTTDPQEQAFLQQYKQCLQDRGEALPTKIVMSGAYQLQPWQATLLAGVPNNPNIFNPYLNPDNAVWRQYGGVLVAMNQYGDDQYLYKLDSNGNKVMLTPQEMSDYTHQLLTQTDKKGHKVNIFASQYQGTNGTFSGKLAPFFVDYVMGQIAQSYPGGMEAFATAGLNVYTTLDYGDPSIPQSDLARIQIDLQTGKLTAKGYNPKKENWLPRVGLEQYAEFVVKRNIQQDFPDYWYCGSNLAHPDYSAGGGGVDTNPFADNQNWCYETPLNSSYTNVHDGALTAIDPRNGDILAMVGGVDYNGTTDTTRAGGQFNVAISTQRSMGSSFKPVVYATALQMGWTPGTVVRDQPTCFPAAGSTEARAADGYLCPGNYMPHNDEYWTWAGPQPIKYLLGNSLNTPAELALSYVGLRADPNNPSPLLAMAQRLGITTLKSSDIGPATAIGTQPVPLIQLTSAYGTFANQGYRVPYRAILSIVRADGKVIQPYVANPPGYQAISKEAAFMITSILDDNNARVADFGPNNPLHFWGRDVAAKTGTSDAERDIVTMGYTPWLALGVWVGNADSESAQNIIGIAGAGYIFHDVMSFAINRLHMPGTLPSRFSTEEPGGYFPVPDDMHLAILNCNTGLAPWKGMNVLDPKSFCDPYTKDRVPLQLTTEFAVCDTAHPGKVPPFNPNEAWNCWGDKGKNEAADRWLPTGWGHINQGVNVPGQDIAWLINGQDPLVP